MITNLDTLTPTYIEHMKNGEGIIECHMATDLPNNVEKTMKVIIHKGCSLGWHNHVDNAEIMYCISGHGTMVLEDKEYDFLPGMVDITKDGHYHQVKNDHEEDLIVLAIIVKNN